MILKSDKGSDLNAVSVAFGPSNTTPSLPTIWLTERTSSRVCGKSDKVVPKGSEKPLSIRCPTALGFSSFDDTQERMSWRQRDFCGAKNGQDCGRRCVAYGPAFK